MKNLSRKAATTVIDGKTEILGETMFDLKAYLSDRRKLIDGELTGLILRSPYRGHLMSAMEYSLMAGGKRLRPVLCVAAAEAVGGAAEDCLAAACALEMIHTYSLIHDDLPAMDDDALRRGKPTCHVAFDEATAILAGDALQAMAFEILSDSSLVPADRAHRWITVIHEIAVASGHRGMVEGQVRDMEAEGKSLTLDELEALHALKTGALINASVCSGAIMGGADEEALSRLTVYAQKIGLAFQVADDLLNVEGDPQLMGKAVGTDLSREKATYPSLLGLEESRALGGELVADALAALDSFDDRSEPLRAIAGYIVDRKR